MKKIKKILIFHPTIAPYRIDFFNDLFRAFDTEICLYYKNLKDQKFRYDWITQKFEFEPDYFEKSVKVFGREIPIGFIKRIKRARPDIVVVNEYSESYWVSLFYRFFSKEKYKIITICDDSADMILNEGGLHAKARQLAMKSIDGLILCNDLAKEAYRNLYPEVKTFVMPILQEESDFLKDKTGMIKRSIEIAKVEQLFGKRVYLFVGRITPVKNLLYLVESFALEHEKNPNSILYIIGNHIPEDQEYNDRVDRLIEEQQASEYIRKIGRKEGAELKAWFYTGQVLVVPSVKERFGAVTNEGLLCGDNVMISSIAGSTCLVDEENGEIIDVNRKYIDFSKMNEKVPLLTEEYLLNKENKMKYSYRECMDLLIEWIDEL